MIEAGETFDVVVVGFGPSGAVATGLLGQAGLKTLTIDKLEQVYDKPRAIALDHEIMRVFQRLGVVDAVMEWAEPFTPSEYYGVDGQLIKRLATVERPYPLGYTPSLVFTQPPVEKILRARAASFPNVRVALQHEFVSLTQDEQSVSLCLRDADGSTKEVKARYVIACDGASSSVRAAVDIKLEDLQFDEPWLVIDVLVNERGLAKLPDTSVQYCEPERPCTYVIGPRNHRRWEISLLLGEDPKQMTTEEGAWSVLKRWITPDDATLWRQASYRFHALVASEWRRGRVFIAGDAAHQQPPFLGQGMCQGVRDVTNLTWKICAVLNHEAGDSLLDTYGEERGLHVRRLTARIKEIGSVICERDVARARERDRQLLAETDGVVRTVPRQDIIPPLQTGLLAASPHPANGTLFPQPRVQSVDGAILLDDVTGSGWCVVTELSADDIAEQARELAVELGSVVYLTKEAAPVAQCGSGEWRLSETEGVMANWFAQKGCRFAIVRPDHYVYGAGNDAGDLEDQLTALHRFLRPEMEASLTLSAEK